MKVFPVPNLESIPNVVIFLLSLFSINLRIYLISSSLSGKISLSDISFFFNILSYDIAFDIAFMKFNIRFNKNNICNGQVDFSIKNSI